MQRFESFADFWPFYLREHSRATTRAFHYVGTSLVIAVAVAAILSGEYWLLAAMPVAGYAFAWASHALVERNRPATFTYPAWSLIADFKMFWLWLRGKLPAELAAVGVPDESVSA